MHLLINYYCFMKQKSESMEHKVKNHESWIKKATQIQEILEEIRSSKKCKLYLLPVWYLFMSKPPSQFWYEIKLPNDIHPREQSNKSMHLLTNNICNIIGQQLLIIYYKENMLQITSYNSEKIGS